MSGIAALLLSLMGTDRLGDPTPPSVMARYGTNRLCVGKGEGELRFHPTREEVTFVPRGKSSAVVARAPRSWRTDTFDEDVDPFPLTKASTDGRRQFTLRFRIDDKADRYRGYPECFVQVFDTLTNRVEARYAFRLDDIGTSERLKPFEYGNGGYQFQDFIASDAGDFLAWTDHNGQLRVRHLSTGRVVKAAGRYYAGCPAAFSPNGKRLAIRDRDGIIRFLDPHTGRLQNTRDNPPTAAKRAAISPDGKRVATGHECGELWVWDAATGNPLWHTEPDGSPLRELHFNPAGTTVSAVGAGGTPGVRTFDAKTGQELGPMLPYRYFRTLAVSADGKRITDLIEEKGVMENGKWAYPLFVRTREIATGKEVKRVRLAHRLGVNHESNAILSRNGRVMVVAHTDGKTFAYVTASGMRLRELPPLDRSPKIGPMGLSADGLLIVRGENIPGTGLIGEGWVTGFEIERGRETRFETKFGDTISDVSLSADGRYTLARSSRVVQPVAYDIRSRQIIRLRTEFEIAFFPDGKSVLTLPGVRGAERVSLEPLAWQVAPPPKPTEARLKQLWVQLGEPAALDAVFELAHHSAEAVPFLKGKLLTEPPDPKAVAAHIGRLGSRLYTEREDSTKALRAFGPAVLPALHAALKAGPSLEARDRLARLIAGHANPVTPFTLARLRAVEVLERCATPDARVALKSLAETATGTPWGDDARRSLQRLRNE